MTKHLRYSFLVLICSCYLFSCGPKESGTDAAPDASRISISYTSYPFYKDFSALDPNHVAAGLSQLKQQYPGFLDFYLDTLISFGYNQQYTDSNRMMYDFLTMKDYRNLLDTVNIAFPDTKKYDDWLKQSFRYIKYYDSSFQLPEQVYYFVSGIRGITAVLQSETNMGIGLDMFLGEDFFPYRQLNKSQFETIRMTPENIPVWAGMAIYEDKYPFNPENKNLLELMIEKGKELYFLEKTTPYIRDEVRLGFTADQLKWCKENEALIYNFFIKNNLLFENNLQKTMRYVSDGPSSAGMPGDSPGNTGSFIGWQIVRRYAAQQKAGMHELLEMKDARKILEGAQYKP
ncbi:gliding motility lipoprotein GldB [Taibaiella helva]|uniref:gliding motility lipoprotein GldB n=1 Tax=Taibaiella helva TaxID=2301235 RepID=UPI000E57F617|nr:hypothetical protein [Taibaiella helva]